ncbi:MAG: sugar phosphate isomerase/epimerase [Planctomycetales bacterium]|nr:sugar phosphate isomerase/epimerase [Planctomycetales bacterium]
MSHETERHKTEHWPLGVFCSAGAGLGVPLEAAHQLGAPTVHLHAPPQSQLLSDFANELRDQLAALGLEATVVFAGFDGESYADIPTVQKTVGLVPHATRAGRVAELKQIIDFTAQLGVKRVGLHVGFVPHDASSQEFSAIVATQRELCDYAGDRSVKLHLETGQEPVDVLLEFLAAVDRPNLFVNFDPANMILYGCGEPLDALRKLGSYVQSVHCKDARWSDRPGDTWGEEVPLGHGDVGFEAFLRTLAQIHYQGPLTIEREIPQEPDRQYSEIRAGLELLTRLKATLSSDGSEEPRP